MLEILGAVPPEPGFRCVEFNGEENIARLTAEHPVLSQMAVLTDSDAHYPDKINEAVHALPIGDGTEDDALLLERLFAYLRGK